MPASSTCPPEDWRQYHAGGSRAANVHFFGTSLYVTVLAKQAVFRLDPGVEGVDYSGPGRVPSEAVPVSPCPSS